MSNLSGMVPMNIPPSELDQMSETPRPSTELEQGLVTQLASLRNLYASFQTQFGSAIESIGSLQPSIAKTRAVEDIATTRAAQILQIQSLLEVKTREISEREREILSLTASLQEKAAEVERIQGALDVRSQKFTDLQHDYDTLVKREKHVSEMLDQGALALKAIQAQAKQEQEHWHRIHEELKAEKISLQNSLDTSNQNRDDVEKVIQEKENAFKIQFADMLSHAEQLGEEMQSLEQDRVEMRGMMDQRDQEIEVLKKERETMKLELETTKRQLEEATARSLSNIDFISQLENKLGEMTDRAAKERSELEGAKSIALNQLSVSQRDLIEQTVLLDATKSEVARQSRENQHLREQAKRQASDQRMALWMHQLRLSASKYVSLHRNQVVEQTQEDLSQAQSSQKEQHEMMERIQQEKMAGISREQDLSMEMERTKAQMDAQAERLVALEQELVQAQARLAAIPPAEPVTEARLKQIEARLKDTERRLRDSVEENFDLKERAAYAEDLELELQETKVLLKQNDLRLRETIDENADLRKRLYKW